MDDKKIYEEVKEYFSIQELVSKKVYRKHGENAWQFLCPRLLHTILVIRKELGRPMTINNWSFGGKFSQRGLRSNLGTIFMGKFKKGILYLSAHVLGKAVDFDVKGMTANEVRAWLKNNADKLPYKIRLENKLRGKYISWCHLDVLYKDSNPKVYLFNV